jgi:hypothetical protein
MCSDLSGPGDECRVAQQIPAWVRWIAQDSNGAWWGYSAEPLRHDSGWYENEAGRYISLGTGNPRDWVHSLRVVRLPPGVTAALLLLDSGEIHYGKLLLSR